LHLAQEAALFRAQERQLVGERQALGQEGVGEAELAAADHVAVDVPADPLGHFDVLA